MKKLRKHLGNEEVAETFRPLLSPIARSLTAIANSLAMSKTS